MEEDDSKNDMTLWPLWLWVAVMICLIAVVPTIIFFGPIPFSIAEAPRLLAIFLPIVIIFGLAAWGAAKRTRYGLYLAIAFLLYLLIDSLIEKFTQPLIFEDDLLINLGKLAERCFGGNFWIYLAWLGYFVHHRAKFRPRRRNKKMTQFNMLNKVDRE